MACEHGRQSRAEIPAQFRVGETTLYRWQQRARAEHRRQAKPHAGGPPPKLDAAALEALRQLATEAGDLTLAEHAGRLAARVGLKASGPRVCRALRAGGARKTLRAAEQDRADLVERRARWQAEWDDTDPARRVFLDARQRR